jgi:phospholipid/cholesterol/gamma-HCH transport system substrate-binding protein
LLIDFKKELKIGVFVVVVLVTSFFVINYLRGKDIFNREIEVVGYFDNVEGLAESAPVFIKGYKAGKVTSVEYMPGEANFRVVCSVMKEFSIPVDSKMTIYATDVMGSKGVKIDLGVSEDLLSNGQTLEPAFEAGLLDGLAAEVTPMLAKVNATLDSLTITVSGVNALLSEANQARIANTLTHLESVMKNVSSIASTIEGRSEDMNAFITNLSSLSSQLNEIAQKAGGTLDGVNEGVGEINQADIKGVVESFHTLLNNINDPDGTVGKLLVDGSVYNSLDSLLTDIDSLVRKIEENPKKYMKLSVF